ncbi:DUF3658 domain-containing protein [Eubacterium sp. 1001713B170207_170306_E7]|uniref:DUF3658 domain-containing protein n=1 Tax=Eubacterium sp. 1001713B170207_170306_E7 TaxID=2787097 RepID=UPI00189B16EF|nr:DUF3658 domain-containing protein [Eubacterium sp. 1001713B170207_170306_E7]
MIELIFGNSSAASLSCAKSMKHGQEIKEASMLRGRDHTTPTHWPGLSLDGSPGDVAPLWQSLDIGELDNAETKGGTRFSVLKILYGGTPGVAEEIAALNRKTLDRLERAAETLEPIRVWLSENNPGDVCEFLFICYFLRESPVHLSAVFVSRQTVFDGKARQYLSTGEILPEDFGTLAQLEEPVTPVQREASAALWEQLVKENAPLRAVVNGRVMSVRANFYDAVLRANIPDGDFMAAFAIGGTLARVPGVSAQWLLMRLQAMVNAGELVEIAPPEGENPYSGMMRRKA